VAAALVALPAGLSQGVGEEDHGVPRPKDLLDLALALLVPEIVNLEGVPVPQEMVHRGPAIHGIRHPIAPFALGWFL
jgi:hypothetical protein